MNRNNPTSIPVLTSRLLMVAALSCLAAPAVQGAVLPAAYVPPSEPMAHPDPQPMYSWMETNRISVGSAGQQGSERSQASPSGQLLSADGRYVVFNSVANNLVDGDYGSRDVFIHDRELGTTELVSVDLTGTGAGSASEQAISSDGRVVAFSSYATDLVATPTSGAVTQVYVRDLEAGITTLASVDDFGAPGDGRSNNPNLSSDGRYVVFSSVASNLGAGSGGRRIYLHDRDTGETVLVSVSDSGLAANGTSDHPVVSADGTIIAFESTATNLVAQDTVALADVYVHDRTRGTTVLASVDSAGRKSNGYAWFPSLSADGTVVAFGSNSSRLVSEGCRGGTCVYVHDLLSGVTENVTVSSDGEAASGASGNPRLSLDGRVVAFYSLASNLVADDTNGTYDIFVHERMSGTTARASVATDGTEGDGRSLYPSLSEDGRVVAFESQAASLVADDTNAHPDVFVRAMATDASADTCDLTGCWLANCCTPPLPPVAWGVRAGSAPVPAWIARRYANTDTQVAAGSGETCVFNYSPHMCIGANVYGQFGNGTLVMAGQGQINPADSVFYLSLGRQWGWVSEERPALDMAVGYMHSCLVLEDDGRVMCWGSSGDAELLGIGPVFSRLPVEVPGIVGATAVTIGPLGNHTCTLLASGKVTCWGRNNYGQLGTARTTLASPPVDVNGIETATAVAAGGEHTCALLADGSVMCWGRNSKAQLGLETGRTSLMSPGVPTPSRVPTIRAQAIAAGGLHSCAVLRDGSVACWGDNLNGQAGDPDDSVLDVPRIVPGIGNAIDVTASYDSTCALLDDGRIKCWGNNKYGQLGNGAVGVLTNTAPQTVRLAAKARQISAGTDHVCAILDEPAARLVCWGRNDAGQLGITPSDGANSQGHPYLTPAAVPIFPYDGLPESPYPPAPM